MKKINSVLSIFISSLLIVSFLMPANVAVKAQEEEAHDWKYTAGDYSIEADCAICGEHAEVDIDTSTVYQASRNYDGEELEYEVCYEDNWSNQEDIASYGILYNGYHTISETESEIYEKVFVQPSSTGNYTVHLALLEDEDDPESEYLSTQEKPFYLADISNAEINEMTYGPTQKIQFTEPKLLNGYYQVGTLSELLWCLYNKNSSANISITSDIVVNPITITDDYEILSAKYQIYKWEGFGTESAPFTGNINGNGHTIYGLYFMNAATRYAGFINCGKDCNVTDLNIENSAFSARNAGAFIAHYESSMTNDESNGKLTKCRSINCYVDGSYNSGGVVGLYEGKAGTSLTLDGCVNDSYIVGVSRNGAGGIVGKIDSCGGVTVSNCYNLANITVGKKNKYCGGIIGYLGMLTDGSANITSDVNTGEVLGDKFSSCIVSYIENTGSSYVHITNCANASQIFYGAGIVYYFDGPVYVEENHYDKDGYGIQLWWNYCTETEREEWFLPYGNDHEDLADSLGDYQDAAIYTTPDNFSEYLCGTYGHCKCTHWNLDSTADCENDGQISLKCMICGQILENKVIRATGHYFEDGECIFCGAIEDEEEDLIGSIFGSTNVILLGLAVVGLTIAAAVWKFVVKPKR